MQTFFVFHAVRNQYQKPCALTQIQSIAVGIKRTTRVTVEDHEAVKSIERKFRKGIGSPGHDHIKHSLSNQPGSKCNGVYGRRASGIDCRYKSGYAKIIGY